MKIIPVKAEYYFEVLKHKMRSEAMHFENRREINYYFDEKLVSTKTLPAGEFITDDDVIREIVENYCKDHNDVFADIFNNHPDKVLLVAKTLDAVIENYGVPINAKIKEDKGYYHVRLSANNEEDVVTGDMKAASFSEVLEKLRMFINTLEGVSNELSQNIDEFSNDKVLELFKWR